MTAAGPELTATELLQQEIVRERSARKEAEALLEQKSLELYQRNTDLQREAQERLRAEQRLQVHARALARSNQELEQFAYAASHDLQAPLRSIVGFSHLLKKHHALIVDDEAREFLGYIESSARHLHLLINDLLEYSRVGRADHKPEWVDSESLVRQACLHLQSEVQERRARILYEGLPRVHADAKQLVQLFQNLIGNAIKYSREGTDPEIRISGAAQSDGWSFAVADNGIGMLPNETERIFVIFQRLHTSEKYPGTGIGLSISKKIVERHGGRIWAESEAGRGSTFHFTLVAAEAAATPAA